LPTAARKRQFIVPIQAWIDESGSKGEGDTFVLAGFIGRAEDWALFSDRWQAVSCGADPMEVADRVEAIYPYGGSPPEVRRLVYDLYEEVTCAHMHGGVPSPPDVERTLMALVAVARGRSPWRPLLESVVARGEAPQNNKMQQTRRG